jgi:hypothetical protein
MAIRRDIPTRIGPVSLGSGNATLFTAPQRLLLTDLIFTNSSASPVTVTLNIVPPGGTAQVSNRLISALSVGANDLYVLTEQKVPIEQGEMIQALASTGAVVNMIGVLTDKEGDSNR